MNEKRRSLKYVIRGGMKRTIYLILLIRMVNSEKTQVQKALGLITYFEIHSNEPLKRYETIPPLTINILEL